ncbi:transporter [Massilia sp. IC2-476]|uniref:transporter n=1 Tax=Massilia sp. IC2-476 TaxID=2887199 RepID=UPI001D10A61C|nr:transporter [Massilia sp. IC2-476]MCC2972294.1 transporter [Massilia sp. IC2-476]
MKPSAILAALAISATPAVHARDTIATDRPDFVESSNVVGRSRLQVETSLLLERDRSGPARERLVATPTLLRYGVGDSFELRVETDGHLDGRHTEPGLREKARGYADTSLGLKWHALDADGSLPSVGVLLHADLDSGSRAFRGQGVRPSLRVVGEWELASDYSLGVMPGVGMEGDEGGRYRYGILGVVVGKSFNERLRGFVEVAMPQIAKGKHGGTQASFDIGGAYLLSDTVQLDAMFSRGLNSRTPDTAFTVGFSFKL